MDSSTSSLSSLVLGRSILLCSHSSLPIGRPPIDEWFPMAHIEISLQLCHLSLWSRIVVLCLAVLDHVSHGRRFLRSRADSTRLSSSTETSRQTHVETVSRVLLDLGDVVVSQCSRYHCSLSVSRCDLDWFQVSPRCFACHTSSTIGSLCGFHSRSGIIWKSISIPRTT